MRGLLAPIATITCALVTSGCDANFYSSYRTFDTQGVEGGLNPKNPSSIAIDAKQRVVISHRHIVCAEPSPDALSAISASFSGNASFAEKFAGALAGSGSEAAGSLGLRTQTITILRDAMYRLCEGYMSGALDKTNFERLQRRYQNNMLGLLAVEQLTGAVVAKPITLTTSSNANGGNSKSLLDAQKALDDGRKSLATAQSRATDVDTALANEIKTRDTLKTVSDNAAAAAKADSSKQAAADDAKAKLDAQQKKVDTAQAEATSSHTALQEAKENVQALEVSRSAALNVSSSSSSGANVYAASGAGQISAETAGKVASAVVDIVKAIASVDYTQETCLEYLVDNKVSGTTAAAPSRFIYNEKSLLTQDEQKNAAEAVVTFCQELLKLTPAQLRAAIESSTIPTPLTPPTPPTAQQAPQRLR
jgi:hypothetical protein